MLAVAAAVAVGVTRPSPAPVASEAIASKATAERSAGAPRRRGDVRGARAGRRRGAQAKAPAPTTGRAQRYNATLTLAVDDTDALSTATQQALAIARDLGGYVVSVQYATGRERGRLAHPARPLGPGGDGGHATLRSRHDRRPERPDRRPPGVARHPRPPARAAPRAGRGADGGDRPCRDPAERARLLERRAQAQAQLQALRANRAATAEVARNATIQLELRTDETSTAPAPGTRLDRALDKALAVLAWEAVVVLAIAVAAAPLVLVALAVWIARRARQRREEDRLLASS